MANIPPAELHHPSQGSRAWFFHEFWPLLVFGGCFLMTMSVPLVMTGFLTLQGILIPAALIASVIVVLTVPRVLALFILLMALSVFLIQPHAFEKGTSIAICFMAFVLIGMVWLPARKKKPIR